MRRIIILLSMFLASASLITGCATDRLGAKMASWQGSHIDSVVSRWGPADRCEVEFGQQVCTWTDGSIVVENGSSSLPFGGISRPRCTRTLAFDASGYVTGWRWRGDGCDVSGRNIMAKNEAARPSAVAEDLNLADEPERTTARK